MSSFFNDVTQETVSWQEEPAIELSEWRVRIACARHSAEPERGKAIGELQAEFMRMNGGPCSLILSPVVDGKRGDEFVLGRAELRALRALLCASNLDEE